MILRDKGVDAGDIILLKMAKSIESMVAIIAIQKLTAAYLAVDPALPPKRIAQYENQSGARLTLSLSEGEWDFTPGTQGQRLTFSESTLDARAYVIYTSGSTGTSKGVQIAQRAVMDLVDSLQSSVYADAIGPQVIALMASLSFDAAIQQVYTALLGGNTLVIVPDDDKKQPAKVIEHFKQHQVAYFDCTPSLLALLLQDSDFHQLSIAGVLVGGEKLASAVVELLFSRSNPPVLWNLYGLTECGVDSIAMKVTKDWFSHWNEHQLPIGHSLPHSRYWLLDRFGRPVPDGLPGELMIGGSGVALGYLNESDEQQQRFWQHRPASTAKVFSTGDYARLPTDGLLRFIGRVDSQVKVRGYRIDLLEVKQAFQDSQSVSDIAVFVDGEQSITAAVCVKPSFNCDDLRAQLKQTLPAYMIPSRIVAVPSIPLTTSGKIDLRQLKNLIEQRQDSQQHTAAHNSTESLLLDFFADWLNYPIGREDDFFDSGAHSLMVLQLIIAVKKQLDQPIDFDIVYRHRTVASLAAYLRQKKIATQSPPILDSTDNIGVFLLPCVLGSAAIFSTLQLTPQWPVSGLDYYPESKPMPDSLEALAKTLHRQIVERDSRSNIILVGYSMGAYVSYEVARLLQNEGKNPGLILIDCHVNPLATGNPLVPDGMQLSDILATIKAQVSPMVKQFTLQQPIPVPIIALEAQDNPVPADMMQWAHYADAFSHHLIQGKHNSVFNLAGAEELSLVLEHALEQLKGLLQSSRRSAVAGETKV
jgi:amino acid adenylation domain-containing protein